MTEQRHASRREARRVARRPVADDPRLIALAQIQARANGSLNQPREPPSSLA
jgi:hypothetical protein